MEEGIKDINDDRNFKSDEVKEVECLDDTSPDNMEGVVNYINYDKNESYEGKEAECLDDTSPD